MSTAETYDFETAEKNLTALKGITSGKHIQSLSVINPETRHTIDAHVEQVMTRDYWGHSTGKKTWTVRVDDTTAGERLWYNYGIESIRDARDQIRKFLV